VNDDEPILISASRKVNKLRPRWTYIRTKLNERSDKYSIYPTLSQEKIKYGDIYISLVAFI